MKTYSIPEGPEGPVGPVWDKDGHKWERLRDDLWFQDGAKWTASKWFQVLHRNGPLTDEPPVKVGDTITLEEFSKLPRNSIAGTDVTAYIVHSDSVRSTYSRDLLDRVVTVLRIGDGSQS